MASNKKEKGTIYQGLNGLFNFDNSGFEDNQSLIDKNKIIIKGNSPAEIKQKALEIEQKRELQKKFFKSSDRSFQKALQYEAGRLQAYVDYEGMEYYPLIASALDLYMEEATTLGINGKMLNIYSNKERIKYLLEEFFYDVINVNVNLPFWTRNVVKYGDNFVLLYGERNKGITHVKQLVNYEIERIERIEKGKPITKFKERLTSNEFNTFEIAHFRLLGDDKYIPYGSSILNKIRRVFRQLIMAEDAMLTYRIIRAGEKKVFKIDVGNIDDDDVEDYVMKVATKFKKVAQVSPNDGQIDYRFNVLGNDEDYFIPVRNSNVQTGIDTLPGATNLNDIHDIEYLRDNLVTGLGIPKPFLSFQDAAGGGKNLAQYDIRFSKKVSRIQQTMIQELNKMAIMHLYLLGYTGEDLSDFTITLTNPSTQQELLKSELLRDKSQTYAEATRIDNGIAAMSHTTAKRLIFNMSDSEIVDDLKKQKMEKVVMQELQDAPVIIKKTGLFKDIDDKYGEPDNGLTTGGVEQDDTSPENEMGGGGGGLPPEGDDMGGGDMPPETDIGGGDEVGGEPPEPPVENVNKNKPVLSEYDLVEYLEKLVYSDKKIKTPKTENNKKIITENNNINDNLNNDAQKMIKEIDNLLETDTELDEASKNNDLNEFDVKDIEIINDIKLDE